ncbi:hypothetical protein EDB89DRAFT_316798 [Lactarius sanguifluus]|nr:hypothetical protein EDB89DRAFT_316798 [Lactarius sanguifluus]
MSEAEPLSILPQPLVHDDILIPPVRISHPRRPQHPVICGSRLRRLARFVTTGVPLKYPGAEALTHQPFSHASRSYQFTMRNSAAPSSIDLITLSTDSKKAQPWPSNGVRNSKRNSGTLDLKVRGASKQHKRSIRLLSVAFYQYLPEYFLARLATDPFRSVSAARLTAPRRNDGHLPGTPRRRNSCSLKPARGSR